MDLEPITPGLEVLFAPVALRCIVRKASRHEDVTSRAKQLDRGVVADLHARARHDGDAAREIRALVALLPVELGAARAHLVVEGVHLRERRLAHVALARAPSARALVRSVALGSARLGRRGLVDLLLGRAEPSASQGRGGRRHRGRRRKYARAAQGADPRLREQRLVGALRRVSLAPAQRLEELLDLLPVGPAHVPCGDQELAARGLVEHGEHAAVSLHLLEHLERVEEPAPRRFVALEGRLARSGAEFVVVAHGNRKLRSKAPSAPVSSSRKRTPVAVHSKAGSVSTAVVSRSYATVPGGQVGSVERP